MAPRLCEVPIRYMLDNIVGGETPTDEVRKKFRFWRVKRVKQESGLYWRASDSVTSALEAADYGDLLHYVPNIASHNKTARRDDQTDTVYDGGIYSKDNPLLPRGVTTLDKLEEDRQRSNLKSAPDSENKRKLGRWSWDHVVVPVKVNYNPRTAPFYFRERDSRVVDGADEGKDTEPGEYAEDEDPNMDADVPYDDLPKASAASGNRFPYIRNTAEGTEGLAQVTDYVTNVFIHQHRTFCYFIYILRNMCRLLYFDRSGAFVSTPFDWTTKETPHLHDFVWKIARIKVKAELGYDPSASFASPAEHEKFVSMGVDPSVPPEIRQYVKNASDHLAPLYKVRIKTTEVTPGERFSDKPDVAAPEARSASGTDAPYGQTHVYEFIIGRPLFIRAESLLGRCTRGFVALRLDPPQGANPLCFLKDCWRAYMPGQTRPEHLVHQRLHEYKVSYIATLICGGDVEGPGVQKTMVQEYFHCEDGRKYVPRVHYRIATEEIGLPLQEFRNFRELTSVMVDVVKAHFYAWDDAKVLHRDISAGNILINPTTRRGFLIDWELSRLECELEVGPVKPDCAGTWISRSALSLKYPRKPYRPWDDIESFVHVYRHLVLRYHPTNTSDFDLYARQTYERFSIVNGIMVGGDLKLMQLRSSLGSPFEVVGNPTLQYILDELALGCYQSYNCIDLEAMRQTYGISWEVAAPKDSRRETAVRHMKDRVLAATQSPQPVREPGSATASPLPPEPTPSSPPPPSSADPCEMRDYLASHLGILSTFLKYKAMPDISDKGEDQFALPDHAVILYAQDRRWTVPSDSSTTIESGSGSIDISGGSDSRDSGLESQAADGAYSPSPDSESVSSGGPGVSNNPKKRAREDEAAHADANFDGADAPDVQNLSRPKRQRGATE